MVTNPNRLFSNLPRLLQNKMTRRHRFTLTRPFSFNVRLAVIATALVAGASQAIAVPVFDTFGPQPTFDFGGSGIPNGAVAASTTFVGTTGSVLFGMTATQRFDNPTVTNDGAGTFFAQPGADIAHGQPTYALWNFDFDSEIIAGSLTGYSFTLWYGSQSLEDLPIGHGDSWNLGMAFLGVPAFDPLAGNVYDFSLDLVNPLGRTIDTVSINVVVGNGTAVPDSGSTVILLGLGLLGLAVLGRRGKKVGSSSLVTG